MNKEEYDMPCDPVSARRTRVPGPVCEKLVTEDYEVVGNQATSSVQNATGQINTIKERDSNNSKQQVLPNLPHQLIKNYERPRSSSLNDVSNVVQQRIDSYLTRNVDYYSDINDTPEVSTQPPSWQKVPCSRKRKRISDPTSPTQHTQTANSFSVLPVDQPEYENSLPKNKPIHKPPPIILYGIQDVNELSKLLEAKSSAEHFKLKIINKNNLRIIIDSIDEYKKIIDIIREYGLIGHTFSRKDTKCFRIVVKNLHHTTPHSAIIEAIEATGNKVRGEIINARYGPNKLPTSTFFINIEPSINNKSVKDIQYIFHQRVKIENPRKSKTVVQCHRCQQYGHSKNNCMRPYRCVKCGEGHKTSDCLKKDRNTPAKCALCFLDHPSNYKGCQVYKEILARKRQTTLRVSQQPKPKSTEDKSTNNQEANPSSKMPYENYPSRRSYAEAAVAYIPTKDDCDNIKFPQSTSALESILLQQNKKIDFLLQQISTLMGLITTLVTQKQK
ncbi:unnamed protein product [Euphydryas editha]|uniref:Pre-C2HC domain-containing protein n=1 Tax=Euphydryas editha TaxID=104508 RepID=A0AAU9U5T7_EUPED|nr:unnamed protein product [Euphydryas editha]